jgi:acyl-CoA synthetase (NDP forming)
VVLEPNELPGAVEGLRAPFVLKAFGNGVVHKSDVGAVKLGLGVDDLPRAITDMTAVLATHSLTPAGFLVEEQHPGGLELVIGVVRRPPFGAVAMLGLGGTFTEALDSSVSRLCPLTPDAAVEMLDSWPGTGVLRGRGPRLVDSDALLAALLAIAGEGGLGDALGTALSELECNPIVVANDGTVALDARLIVHRVLPESTSRPPPTDFTRLFAPRSIAVAGASSSKVTFGNRFLAAYRDAGWAEGLHAVHPTASEIDGVPAVSSVTEISGGVDYLLVALPAAQCADVVSGAAGSVVFAHVVAGGFGETGPEGKQLETQLLDAAREARVRVLGPNCLGVFSPRGRQTFQLGAPRVAGSVSVISQSGGLAGDIVMAGDRRGIRF